MSKKFFYFLGLFSVLMSVVVYTYFLGGIFFDDFWSEKVLADTAIDYLELDGVDQYVDLGIVSSLKSIGTDSFTVEGWFFADTAELYETLFSLYEDSTASRFWIRFNRYEPYNRLELAFKGAGGSEVVSETIPIVLGRWHHYAVAVDRTNNQINFYLDGNFELIQDITRSIDGGLSASTYNPSLGIYLSTGYSPRFPFDGKLGETRFWSGVRTSAEIRANINTPIESHANLLSRWAFDDGEGTQVTNSVGAVHGVTQNSPTWGSDSDRDLTFFVSSPTLSGDDLTLNGDIVNLGDSSSVDVAFSYGTASDNLNLSTATTTVESAGSFSIEIPDITLGTTYYYMLNASSTAEIVTSTVQSFGNQSLIFYNDDAGTSAYTEPSTYVNLGSPDLFNLSSNFTIEGWFKSTDAETASTIFQYGLNPVIKLKYISDTEVYFRVIDDDGNALSSDSITVSEDVWHHYAIVWDRTNQMAYVYFNGVAVDSFSIVSITTLNPTGFDFIVGAESLSGGIISYFSNYWEGSMDELRVWNTARTGQEISDSKNIEIISHDNLAVRLGFEDYSVNLTNTASSSYSASLVDKPMSSSFVAGGALGRTPLSTVNSPADDATQVTSTSRLSFVVSDSNADDINVRVYGRENTAHNEDFTFVVLPDTQKYAQYNLDNEQYFEDQVQWILDNEDGLNIKFVVHLGDITQSLTNESEWSFVSSTLANLDGEVPYLVVPGNHDFSTCTEDSKTFTHFNNSFPYTRFNSYSWYGGHYPLDGNENSYGQFSSGGRDYLALGLNICPSDDDLAWAENVISTNSDKKVIIFTHIYLSAGGEHLDPTIQYDCSELTCFGSCNNGDDVWNDMVSEYPNILMVLSGHVIGDDGDAVASRRVDYYNDSSVHRDVPIFQLLQNFQKYNTEGLCDYTDESNQGCGLGYLRYYTFKPDSDTIEAYSYSPSLEASLTDSSNQFDLSFPFSTDDYSLLYSEDSVSSGSTVTYDWESLDETSNYEWFVVTIDGSSTSTSDVVSFTTNDQPGISLDGDFASWETGNVEVNYNIIDSDGDTVNLSQGSTSGIEYSLDNTIWSDATEASSGSDGLTGLSSSGSTGTDHVFVWDSVTNLGETENTTVYVRLRASDGLESGDNWTTSTVFIVDGVDPAVSLSSPASGFSVNVSDNLNFSWSGSDGGSGIQKYQLYIDGALYQDNITDSSVTISANIAYGDHTWNVVAYDNVNKTTTSSETYSFNVFASVGTLLPASPVVLPITTISSVVEKKINKVEIEEDKGKIDFSNLEQMVPINATIFQTVIESGYGTTFLNNSEKHYLVNKGVRDGVVNLVIHSEPNEINLSLLEEKVLDLDSDGNWDLHVLINSVDDESGKADITVTDLSQLPISINYNYSSTDSRNVMVSLLGVANVDQMVISEDGDFTEQSFVDFKKYNPFVLSEGDGEKKIYVKLRTKQGGTRVLSGTIKLQSDGYSSSQGTGCDLDFGKIYKSESSPAVYYITNVCTKRPIASSKVFFSYFDSWAEVNVISQDSLDVITNDPIGFMPWGPKYDPKYGALVKIVTDPKVYLLLGTERYWIISETVFTTLNYAWNWIEDVDPELLNNYTLGSLIDYTNHHPNYTIVKYEDSPKVYRLEPNPEDTEQQVKRWIPNEATFNSLEYRWDRIVTIDDGEVYEDGGELGNVPDTENIVDNSYVFTSFLTLGSSGEEVEQLQLKLKELGYFPADTETNSYFGPTTERAVKDLQTANNLEPFGYVGSGTREVLNR